MLLEPEIKIPLSEALVTVIFSRVLPLPEIVIPLPELPLVCEKSIVALFLPTILTPAGRETAPDLTVPSITIVCPDLAFLTASASEVPPFLTVISPVTVEPELPEELLPELPEEPLPELPELFPEPLESTCIL